MKATAIRLYRLVVSALAGVLFAACGCQSIPANNAPPQQPDVVWDQLPNVIGSLGKPLGTFMVVEGKVPDGPTGLMVDPFEVDAIDGKSVAPVVIEVEAVFLKGDAKLNPWTRHRLRGYETGGYEGVAIDPERRTSLAMGPQDDVSEVPQILYHFGVSFRAFRELK